MVEVSARKIDRFDVDVSNPPTGPIDDQKATFHLKLKEKHDACGQIYKKADALRRSSQSYDAKTDPNLMKTLEFLYDSCIMYQADKNTWNTLHKENLYGDKASVLLANQLVPDNEVNVDEKKAVNQVVNSKEFEKLKEAERRMGKPFHEVLKEHVHDKNILKDHLFFNH